MPRDFIPPYIAPPESQVRGLRGLRAASSNIISSWPKAVYRDGFYRPPVPGILMVMEEQAVGRVLCDPDTFPQSEVTRRALKPVWKEGISTSMGEEWKWQRRAAAPVFTPKAVEQIIPYAERAARLLCQRWREQSGSVEITLSLADAVTHVVFDAFLASTDDEAERAAFSHWGDRLTEEMSKLNLADILQLPGWTRKLLGSTYATPSEALHALVARILASGKHNGGDQASLLAMLAQSVDPSTDRKMSVDLLEDNIVGTLAAGRETTALTLSWATWLLGQNQPLQRQLRGEITEASLSSQLTANDISRVPLAKRIIMETLRLYSPAPQIVRQCAAAVDFGEVQADEGSILVVPIYAIQRHERYWEDPHAFDPDRFLNDRFDARKMRFRYMPFGGGQRICLGMSFALIELQAMLITLVREFEILPDVTEAPIDFEVGITLRPRAGLRSRFHPINQRPERMIVQRGLKRRAREFAQQATA